MKFNIIVDSASNISPNVLSNDNIEIKVASLILNVDGTEFVDDANIDTHAMLTSIKKSKKPRSSCPSPYSFYSLIEEDKYNIIITMSSKLSGSYNSANAAISMLEKTDNVFLMDSKFVAGVMRLIVERAVNDINSGASFEEIKEDLIKYRDSLNLLFVLDKFDTLVKNGRVSKIIAKIASLVAIKPICAGVDGEIKMTQKIRTFDGAIKKLANIVIEKIKTSKVTKVIISHTENLVAALKVKELVNKVFKNVQIQIEENKGLCSFYSMTGGLIVSF